MADADDQSCSPSPTKPRRLWLLGLILIISWASLGFWVWHTVREFMPVRFPRKGLAQLGAYDTALAVTGPATLRLADLGEVRLAGVCPPKDATARDRAMGRLRELVPAGTRVYAEAEGGQADAARTLATASVFLPPSSREADRPFPYGEAVLLGAALLREGLARVDRASAYRYRAEFLMLEHDARRHGRGLWAGP